MRTLPILLLLLPGALAWADEFDGKSALTIDQIAEIKADQDRAKEKVVEKYRGDDTANPRTVKREIRDAMESVLEDRGVDKAEYLRQLTHVNREQKAAINDKAKAINDARPLPKSTDEWGDEPNKFGTKASKATAAPPETKAEEHPAQPPEPASSSDKPASAPSEVPSAEEKAPEIIRGYSEDHPVEINVPSSEESSATSAAH